MIHSPVEFLLFCSGIVIILLLNSHYSFTHFLVEKKL